MSAGSDPQEHWHEVHGSRRPQESSWWQDPDGLWLDLIDAVGLPPTAPVIDVGAGASVLVDELIAHGWQDVTILDIADTAIAQVRERLGPRAEDVDLVVGDVRSFRPGRRFALWHDRAVLHFLTDQHDVEAYRASLLACTTDDAVAIIATFAPDGPERCSGLPVHRYSAAELADVFAPEFTMVSAEQRMHSTPSGGSQAFTVVTLRRTRPTPA